MSPLLGCHCGWALRMVGKPGKKEGSSEMWWYVKIHGGSFQGIKTNQCVQPLPGAPRSSAEVCAASFLLQLCSNHLIMSIWVTFPLPLPLCPEVLESVKVRSLLKHAQN